MKTWSVTKAWNESIAGEEREMTPRDYLYASELGQSHIDIILKMRGTKQTNPPNARARRKFFMGNVAEDILYLALLRCGLIIDSQVRGNFQYDGLLSVHGRCDFIAGGRVDYLKSKQAILDMRLSDWMEAMSLKTLDKIAMEMGDTELKPIVIENKSVSSFMYEKYAASNAPNPHHAYQLFHYLKAFKMDEGRVFYTNKDDAMLLEFAVFNPSDVEKGYKDEIAQLTEYYVLDTLPPLAKEIVFDDQAKKFTKNWRVEYSPYLTMLYPQYERPDMYVDAVKGTVSRWNRVLARIKKIDSGARLKPNKKYPDGAPMELTQANIDVIAEIKSAGWDAKELSRVAEVTEDASEDIGE